MITNCSIYLKIDYYLNSSHIMIVTCWNIINIINVTEWEQLINIAVQQSILLIRYKLLKNIFQYFLSQLYRWVIILYINCRHQWAVIIWGALKTLFEYMCARRVYFSLEIPRSHVYTMEAAVLTTHFTKLECLSVVAQDLQNHLHRPTLFAGKWKCMYCNVTGYR